MGLIAKLRQRASEEIDAYKNRRRMEKDPVVLKAMIKDKESQLAREQDYQRDREKLKELKNKTGVRGGIVQGLGAVKQHLANVKERNARLESGGRKMRLQNPRESSSSNGLLSSSSGRGMHSDLPGNRSALMSGVGSGKSPVLNSASGKSPVMGNSSGKSPVLGDKKKSKGVFG